MAFKHRKLLPTETLQNQTIDCSVFCDPACPYNLNCFPILDPDLIIYPPPPPLKSSYKDHPISAFMIIIITVLSTLFLLISYYAIIIKHCGARNRSNTIRSQSHGRDEEPPHTVVDHPIWLITTVGLQQPIINSITVCKYKKTEGLIDGTDCAVCLGEFKEDDMLRLLPKCNHAFHACCIDVWLRSHTNCPLCRARIVSEPVISTSDIRSQNMEVGEDTQIGDFHGDGENSENQVINSGFEENRARTEDIRELPRINEDEIGRSKKLANFDTNNGCSDNSRNSFDNHQNMDKELFHQFRKSASMESSSSSSLLLVVDEINVEGSSENLKRNLGKPDSDRIPVDSNDGDDALR